MWGRDAEASAVCLHALRAALRAARRHYAATDNPFAEAFEDAGGVDAVETLAATDGERGEIAREIVKKYIDGSEEEDEDDEEM